MSGNLSVFFHDNKDQTNRPELYNLNWDIEVTQDIARRFPAKVKEVNGMPDDFIADTKAVIPVPNPDYDPCL